MKTRYRLFVGALLSSGIFYLAYQSPEQPVVASTGYNATARGFFEWDRYYVESDHVWNGHRTEFTILREGHIISYPHLLTEIAFCSLFGFGLAAGCSAFFSGGKRPALQPSEW